MRGKHTILSGIGESLNTAVAVGTVSIVVLCGIYYIMPPLNGYTWDGFRNGIINILLSPITITARVGSKLGAQIMKNGFGYKYTAAELEELRPILFTNAKVEGTVEHTAAMFHDILLVPGQSEQLQMLITDQLSNDPEWAQAVVKAYFPMYYKVLPDAIDALLIVEQM